MNILRIASFVLLIALGISVFIFGGSDDSPGAQLLGAVLAGSGIAAMIRRRKKPGETSS